MLRRTIYTEVAGFGVGRIKEVAPDVTIKMFHPTLGTEIATDELEALLVNSDGEVLIFVLSPETKSNLLRVLTGGLHVVGADEMPDKKVVI